VPLQPASSAAASSPADTVPQASTRGRPSRRRRLTARPRSPLSRLRRRGNRDTVSRRVAHQNHMMSIRPARQASKRPPSHPARPRANGLATIAQPRPSHLHRRLRCSGCAGGAVAFSAATPGVRLCRSSQSQCRARALQRLARKVRRLRIPKSVHQPDSRAEPGQAPGLAPALSPLRVADSHAAGIYMLFLAPAMTAYRPSVLARIIGGGAIGALCGAVPGALIAIPVSRTGRRFRMT